MNSPFTPPPTDAQAVRPDFVPAADYISAEFMAREEAAIWPHTWQLACREEELPNVGDYVTYDINNESVIVVRTAGGLRAHHNVCPHRGRRLTEGCGRAGLFHCRFHSWQWNLEGENTQVIDHHDWEGVLPAEDIALKPVHVDSWGGFVYVNFEADPEPLHSYLAPVIEKIGPYKTEELRYKWYRSIVFPCNWKVALEAFNEGYHVQGTHRQLLSYNDDLTMSASLGRHAYFGYPVRKGLGQGSPRLGQVREDVRQAVVDYYFMMLTDLNAMFTQREGAEIKRLPDEVPADASMQEVMVAYRRLQTEAAEKSGVKMPELTPEEMMSAGGSFHMFPNMIVLPMPMSLLGYRVRPNGSPDSCIFEAFALERWAPGDEPKWEKTHSDDPRDVDFWGLILTQDFENMGSVQKGMKSSAFKGSRTNPKQEVAVSNFHRVIHQYIQDREKA